MKLVIEITGENGTKSIKELIVRIEVEVENLVKLLNYVEGLRRREVLGIEITEES